MPEMDGFEATLTIRQTKKQSGKRVPIVAMTAHALKGTRNAAWGEVWTVTFRSRFERTSCLQR